MEDYNAQSNRLGIGGPEIHALAKSTEEKIDVCVMTTEEVIHEQGSNSYCRQRHLQSDFLIRRIITTEKEFLTRKAPIEGAVQKVVSMSLNASHLNVSALPDTGWSPWQRRMYYAMRKEY